MELPPYRVRPATARDARRIRSLIWQVLINPVGLDWRRFILAEAEDGSLVACGQIKPHGDGTRELASVAVAPAWRGRGAARAIIERLLEKENGPLYLTCRSRLGPLYQKFGFASISWEDAPPYFRRILPLRRLGLVPKDLLLMKRT